MNSGIFVLVSFLTVILALMITALLARADVIVKGRVEYIVDGDSMIVDAGEGDQEIRLWGIDSPEYDQKGAEQSRDALSRLTLGKQVAVRIKYHDRYGRTVAEISDGETSINELMVAMGHSWVHPYFCRKPVCRQWKKLENEARRQGIGLWNYENPIPPWQWKKRG